MFGGYVTLDASYVGVLLVTDGSLTPVNADALPTYRVYGPDGFVKDGTTLFKDEGTISNATNASPIVITSTSHGLTTGALITLSGATGNTAANGTNYVTRIDSNTFSLDGTTGDGAYVDGGTWNVTGLYGFTISAAGIEGYDAGENYQAQFSYDVAAAPQSQIHSFQVN